MQGTAVTALEPLVSPRISTEIGLVLAAAVDGMLSQPVAPSQLADDEDDRIVSVDLRIYRAFLRTRGKEREEQ